MFQTLIGKMIDTQKEQASWPGEICKRCLRRNVIGFDITDDVWEAVVRNRWNVLCSSCFDEEAQLSAIPYKFSNTYPVTWSMWGDEP